MCAIVASTDMTGALQQIMAFAPPVMQTVLAPLVAGSTDSGMVAFGWNHPVTHALGLAVAISLGARAIAGEIENGAIELVAAQPISRQRYLLANVLFAMGAITAMSVLGVSATAVGQRAFGLDPFPPARLLQLILSYALLQGGVFAITLAFSAFGREAGRVGFSGVLVALLSYLAQAIAALWPRAAWVGPFSLHYYYDPREVLVNGHFAPTELLVLLAVLLVATGVAFARFRSRDLP